jgi:hypothetical protein
MTLAISTLIFDPGISTLLNFAFPALRTRVSISAIGSVIAIGFSVLIDRVASLAKVGALPPGLPTRFNHTGQFALGCHVPETDAANAEFPDESARPPAKGTAIISSDAELGFALRLGA